MRLGLQQVIGGVRRGHRSTNSAHNGVVKVDPFLVGAMVADSGVVLAVVCHNCLERVQTGLGIIRQNTVKHL